MNWAIKSVPINDRINLFPSKAESLVDLRNVGAEKAKSENTVTSGFQFTTSPTIRENHLACLKNPEKNQEISNSSSNPNEEWQCEKIDYLWVMFHLLKTQGGILNDKSENEAIQETVWTGQNNIFKSAFGVQVADEEYQTLRENPDIIPVELKEKYGINHIGSPAVYKGYAILPLEDGKKNQDGKNYQNPMFALCDLKASGSGKPKIIGWVRLDSKAQNDGVPWVEANVDAKTGEAMLYTSRFGGPDCINKFKLEEIIWTYSSDSEALESNETADAWQNAKVLEEGSLSVPDNQYFKFDFDTGEKIISEVKEPPSPFIPTPLNFSGEKSPCSVQAGRVLGKHIYTIDDSDKTDKKVFRTDLETGETEEIFTLNDALNSFKELNKDNLLLKLSYSLFSFNELLKACTKGYLDLGFKTIEAEGIFFSLAPKTGEPILHATMLIFFGPAFLKYAILHYQRIPQLAAAA